ncbi:MAG: D-2-hydroxyacid dehydrogenase [Myxococcota bacterium]|nr:D-2-hydroxyacid dehydrogenase [Myxococcota bacterium]
MSNKVVFLDRSTIIANFTKPDSVEEWVDYSYTESDEIVERLQGADVAVVNKTIIDRDTLSRLPKLRLIAVAATGVNNLDLKACKELNKRVCNVEGYAKYTVAEHCIGYILALRRNLISYRNDVRDGQWQKAKGFCLRNHAIRDLRGDTLGIIGYGEIGQQMGLLAKSFGMKVLVAERKGASRIREGRTAFCDVLRESDVVSLHCALTEDNHHLVSREQFDMMKPESILVNTARGSLMDSHALVEALKTKTIAGAIIDVLPEEPPARGSPLLEYKGGNLFVSPHIAWASTQAMQALADQLVSKIETFLKGEKTRFVI